MLAHPRNSTLDQVEQQHALNQLMTELNGTDRLCSAELTAAYIGPLLKASGKVIKYVEPMDRVIMNRNREIDND